MLDHDGLRNADEILKDDPFILALIDQAKGGDIDISDLRKKLEVIKNSVVGNVLSEADYEMIGQLQDIRHPHSSLCMVCKNSILGIEHYQIDRVIFKDDSDTSRRNKRVLARLCINCARNIGDKT